MNRIIFTDYDGTFIRVDSCFAMVKAFASSGWEEVDQLWQEKKFSTLECTQ